MKAKTPLQRKKPKLYTIDEANAMLPLLRSILRDITELATDLRDRYERLVRLQQAEGLDKAHEEEVEQLLAEFERGQEKMREYELELEKLDVELKDYYTGLIDFHHLKDGKEVYLCWRLGESEIAHWHELNAGFQGRKKLEENVVNG
jgi:hypothetical protein